MGRTKASQLTLATCLTTIAALSGCSSTPTPGMEHGRLIQPQTTEGPFCERHSFGEVKRGEIQHTAERTANEPVPIASDDHPSDASKVLILNHPLDPLPIEIARIRRGVVKRFTGKFLREGEVGWAGIDLERLVAVSVERRVYDLRAHLSRPVADPVFSQIEQLSFARKWTDGRRVEVEVVKVAPITLPEAQLVVCASNPLWADKAPLPDEETTDMSDGIIDVFLLDHRQAQDLSYKYTKSIYLSESLANILGGIWAHEPQGPAW